MKKTLFAALVLAMVAMAAVAPAQKDNDDETNSLLNFLVVKEENGKPVRNAAVIMHPVTQRGKQGQGGMELKTNAEGKANFDGIPYGMLRVQVLAQGFQTYGEDFNVDKPRMDLTIKLKRPQSQYSVYENKSKDSNSTPPPKQDAPPKESPPPDQKSDKPN